MGELTVFNQTIVGLHGQVLGCPNNASVVPDQLVGAVIAVAVAERVLPFVVECVGPLCLRTAKVLSDVYRQNFETYLQPPVETSVVQAVMDSISWFWGRVPSFTFPPGANAEQLTLTSMSLHPRYLPIYTEEAGLYTQPDRTSRYHAVISAAGKLSKQIVTKGENAPEEDKIRLHARLTLAFDIKYPFDEADPESTKEFLQQMEVEQAEEAVYRENAKKSGIEITSPYLYFYSLVLSGRHKLFTDLTTGVLHFDLFKFTASWEAVFLTTPQDERYEVMMTTARSMGEELARQGKNAPPEEERKLYALLVLAQDQFYEMTPEALLKKMQNSVSRLERKRETAVESFTLYDELYLKALNVKVSKLESASKHAKPKPRTDL